MRAAELCAEPRVESQEPDPEAELEPRVESPVEGELEAKRGSPWRTAAVATGLGALVVLPWTFAVQDVGGAGELVVRALDGAGAALDAVGWVLVPQTALGVAVLGLALQRFAYWAAGVAAPPPPSWIDPAVESALLLGMLGTMSGMVSGFVGLSPDALEPARLIHALGTALRSSLVGFSIALVGVWLRERPNP